MIIFPKQVRYLLQYAHRKKNKMEEVAMNTRKNKKGQTMLEYIIIVALIAISLIAVFTYFGGAVGKKVAGATEAIDDGDAAQGARNKADEIIDGAESGNVIKRLGNN